MESVLNLSVLVLNKNYTPIWITNVKRAFSMLWQNIASVVSVENTNFCNYNFNSWVELSELKRELKSTDGFEDWVETPNLVIEVPRIIRLDCYDTIPKRKVRLSRRNIMERDDHVCQYCKEKKNQKDLNIDHVLPRSKGGQTKWTNLVTACFKCNGKKANRTPAEAGMKLLKKPKEPKIIPFMKVKITNDKYASWKHFISTIYWNTELVN